LTVVREITRLLPHEDIIYFGDTARMPYGGKGRETIVKYACESVEFLRLMNTKLIVAACGTVSAVLDDVIKINSDFGIPIYGVVKPSCKSALKLSKNQKIGVIGTESAINSRQYERVIKKLNSNAQIFQNACPLLAPLIESGFARKSKETLINVIKIYIEPLLKEGIDTLILGCTHYPIIKGTISEIAPNINLIDSGQTTAEEIYELLVKFNLISDKKTIGKLDFYASDLTENFSENIKLFLGKGVDAKLCNFSKIEI
jgi:glutamate racemase